MIQKSTLGFPRIGKNRELKRLVESYFRGEISGAELESGATALRAAQLTLQVEHGITVVPSNDFSLYDHVLDLAQSIGAIPEIEDPGELSPLEEYFLLARGRTPTGKSGRALEMTKWFDTNYHYLVPEIDARTRFSVRFNRARRAYQEALALGVRTRPVLLGPVSFLLLSKNPNPNGPAPLTRLADLVPVYAQLLRELAEAGADSVQLDEPCLVLEPTPEIRAAFERAYAALAAEKIPSILLATYFGSIARELDWLRELPVSSLHVDVVRAPEQLDRALASWPAERTLSLGVVDGRNVWRADLDALLSRLEPIVRARGSERLILSTSCSLLHAPVDLASETRLDPELRSWLSFAVQKMDELTLLGRALDEGQDAVRAQLDEARKALDSRRKSPRVVRPDVRARLGGLTEKDFERGQSYETRADVQRRRLSLPPLPTTTIGSFPQTDEIRKRRADFKAGRLDRARYERFLDETIRDVVARQERLGLDVLVHGEAERNDMVEYFAGELHGFAETDFGWVQSYGARSVKPPILYGDVERKGPMTVREAKVAQEATKKPVKGMLTGPVTILKWSFVRDDEAWSNIAYQVGLALRDEIHDLEEAGISIVQVDEAALREGLPLEREKRADYLSWSVRSFRLATSGARPETQVHTHMCYSEFGDILDSIVGLDADVISIETTRSRMELLDDFGRHGYPNEMGPGVYDIHSPRSPSVDEMADLVRRAALVIPPERLWVNPDCGLKTRGWSEVTPALENMVSAAHRVRRELGLV